MPFSPADGDVQGCLRIPLALVLWSGVEWALWKVGDVLPGLRSSFALSKVFSVVKPLFF